MRISAGVLKLCVVAVGLCCLVAVPTGQQPARRRRRSDLPGRCRSWPKMPLPKNWIMEAVPVMATDYEDHIWVISRSGGHARRTKAMASHELRRAATAASQRLKILEFDTQGNVLNAVGRSRASSRVAPRRGQIHTVVVDKEHNVWISAAGRGNGIQKFTRDGKFLLGFRASRADAGRRRAERQPCRMNSQQTDVLNGGVFIFTLDEPAQEIYLVEGKRVLVYGYDGTFKRGMGRAGHAVERDDEYADAAGPLEGRPSA